MTNQLRGENLQPGMTVRAEDGHEYRVTHVLGGSVFGTSPDDAANRDWNLGAKTQTYTVIEEN